jgi:hypothetical protein
MAESNFAELRRVRSAMSAEAGHDIRKFVELLEPYRQKYAKNLVNHGGEAKATNVVIGASQPVTDEHPVSSVR